MNLRSIALITMICAAPGGALAQSLWPASKVIFGDALTLEDERDRERVFTHATLPTCDAGAKGNVYTIDNGANNSDCLTGGGTSFVECGCDGSIYRALSGGGAAVEINDLAGDGIFGISDNFIPIGTGGGAAAYIEVDDCNAVTEKLNFDGTNFTCAVDREGAGAPDDVDYLVGTADAGLSNEIVVGTTPGGELGNTWASPTVDDVHADGTDHHLESHVLSSHPDINFGALAEAQFIVYDNDVDSAWENVAISGEVAISVLGAATVSATHGTGGGSHHTLFIPDADPAVNHGDFNADVDARVPGAEDNNLQTLNTGTSDDFICVGTASNACTYVEIQDCANGTESLDWDGDAFVCNTITGGSASDSFKTWAAPAGPDAVADSPTDTITFSGTRVTITTANDPETINFVVDDMNASVASESVVGIVEHATQTEANNAAAGNLAIIASTLGGFVLTGELGGTLGSPTVDNDGHDHTDSTHPVLANHIDDIGEIATAIKSGPVGDLRILSTDSTNPGTPECMEMQTDGSVIRTGSACGSGGGDVATDDIWTTLGDLAVGTGSSTAIRLGAGANDTMLMADSGTGSGLKWGTPATVRTALSLVPGTDVAIEAQILDTVVTGDAIDHAALVGTGADAAAWTNAIPDCNTENHLTFEQTGNTWGCESDSTGGSPTFSAITGSTNITAAMVVGTGASLVPSGSGTVRASESVVADIGSDTTSFILLATDATGNLSSDTDAGLTYDAATDRLSAGELQIDNINLNANAIEIGNNTNSGTLRIFDSTGAGSNVNILAGDGLDWDNWNFRFPTDNGDANDVLMTNGVGDHSYVPVDTAFISDVSVTQTELAELQTIDDTAISVANWVAVSNLTGTNTDDEVAATEGVAGILELATQTETDTGTDDVTAVTPLKLATKPHSHAGGGPHPVNLATDVDTGTLLDGNRVEDWTTTSKGIGQIATQPQTDLHINDVAAVTPLKLGNFPFDTDLLGTIKSPLYGADNIDGDNMNANYAGLFLSETPGPPDTIGVDAELTTGSACVYIEDPIVENMNEMWQTTEDIVIDRIWCKTESTTVSVDLQNGDGTPIDIMSSPLVCDSGEETSCASGCDVNTIDATEDNVAQYDEILVNITAIGGSGGRVTLCWHWTVDDV